jgi:hypothetical protein
MAHHRGVSRINRQTERESERERERETLTSAECVISFDTPLALISSWSAEYNS